MLPPRRPNCERQLVARSTVVSGGRDQRAAIRQEFDRMAVIAPARESCFGLRPARIPDLHRAAEIRIGCQLAAIRRPGDAGECAAAADRGTDLRLALSLACASVSLPPESIVVQPLQSAPRRRSVSPQQKPPEPRRVLTKSPLLTSFQGLAPADIAPQQQADIAPQQQECGLRRSLCFAFGTDSLCRRERYARCHLQGPPSRLPFNARSRRIRFICLGRVQKNFEPNRK